MSALRLVSATAVLLLVSLAASLAAAELVVRALDAWRARGAPTIADQVLAIAREAGAGADTFNVYYLGESSMVGVPYDPRLSIPLLLDAAFGGHVGGRPLRAVNLGRSGVDLAFEVARIDPVLADPARFHPGLVVVYAGHNEFLPMAEPHLVERDGPHAWQRWLGRSRLLDRVEQRLVRAYPLEIDARALLDRPLGSPAAMERVYTRYEEELAHVVDAAARAGVPVVLSTVAANVADFEPNRSVYCGPPARRDEFRGLLDAADAAARAGRDDDALARLDAAAALCDRFAELDFRRARLLERRGDRAGAAAAYRAAVDHDAAPIRVGTRQNDAIRRVGAAHGVPVADPAERLAALGPRPAPGYEWFVDAHHPDAAAYVWIAREIAEAVRARLGVPGPLAAVAPDTVEERFALRDPDFAFEKLVQRGRWFSRIATLRFDPADRLDRAAAAFASAGALRPAASDPHIGLAMVAYLRRAPADGDREMDEARRLDAGSTDAYLEAPWVRAVIARARVAGGNPGSDHAGPGGASADGHAEAEGGR